MPTRRPRNLALHCLWDLAVDTPAVSEHLAWRRDLPARVLARLVRRGPSRCLAGLAEREDLTAAMQWRLFWRATTQEDEYGEGPDTVVLDALLGNPTVTDPQLLARLVLALGTWDGGRNGRGGSPWRRAARNPAFTPDVALQAARLHPADPWGALRWCREAADGGHPVSAKAVAETLAALPPQAREWVIRELVPRLPAAESAPAVGSERGP